MVRSMSATKSFLTSVMLLVWVLPLTGAFDPLIVSLPLQTQAIGLMIYCTTFAMFMPIKRVDGKDSRAYVFLSIVGLGVLSALLFSSLSIAGPVSILDLVTGDAIPQRFPVSAKDIYAVNGLYVLCLRYLQIARRAE